MAFRDLITENPPAPGELDWGTKLNAFLNAVEAAVENYVPAGVVIVVTHGTDANRARPADAASVLWIGSVEPVNRNPDADLLLAPAGLA